MSRDRPVPDESGLVYPHPTSVGGGAVPALGWRSVKRTAKKYWLCNKCGRRNERTQQKCPDCRRSRPKPRVPEHAKTLRDDPYERYVQVAKDIHGVSDERCCVCDRPRSQERRHDRDHGHLRGDPAYGKPRGLACPSCNILMPRTLSLERARQITAYLARVDSYYREAA